MICSGLCRFLPILTVLAEKDLQTRSILTLRDLDARFNGWHMVSKPSLPTYVSTREVTQRIRVRAKARENEHVGTATREWKRMVVPSWNRARPSEARQLPTGPRGSRSGRYGVRFSPSYKLRMASKKRPIRCTVARARGGSTVCYREGLYSGAAVTTWRKDRSHSGSLGGLSCRRNRGRKRGAILKSAVDAFMKVRRGACGAANDAIGSRMSSVKAHLIIDVAGESCGAGWPG